MTKGQATLKPMAVLEFHSVGFPPAPPQSLMLASRSNSLPRGGQRKRPLVLHKKTDDRGEGTPRRKRLTYVGLWEPGRGKSGGGLDGLVVIDSACVKAGKRGRRGGASGMRRDFRGARFLERLLPLLVQVLVAGPL